MNNEGKQNKIITNSISKIRFTWSHSNIDIFYPLCVYGVVVLGEGGATVVGVPETKGLALFVVGEDHDNGGIPIGEAFLYHPAVLGDVAVYNTVHYLRPTDPVCIVVVGISLVPGGDACKLSAVLPCQVGIGLDTLGNTGDGSVC